MRAAGADSINLRKVYLDSEHFPQGGLGYLERLVGWASDAGLYISCVSISIYILTKIKFLINLSIVLDLHGAPGAQVAQNAFTGQVSSLHYLHAAPSPF